MGEGNRPRPLHQAYGGQAVIEGVMMRNRTGMCIAVRSASGAIVTRREDFTSRPRLRLWELPVFRGMAALYDSVKLGVDALLWSAGASGETDEQLQGWQAWLAVALSMGLAVGLFMVLPTLLTAGLRSLPGPAGYARTVGLNLLEGLVRATILVAYIAVVSRMPEVRRVLQYHGAEHRVIHACEAGEPLTAQAAARYPVLHPRCGTSFLLYVVMVSTVVFSFFGWPGLVERLVTRLAMLPLVAGISYEWVRLAGNSRSRLVEWMCRPGLWLQRLTAQEPDPGQVEVALAALAGLRGEELSEEARA